jgi:hypothetical protein
MPPIVMVWFLIKVISVYFILIKCGFAAENKFSNILFYPLLNDFFNDDLSLNTAGRIIAFVLFTILFLPALLFYYVVLIVLGIIALLGITFITIFTKKEKGE